MPPEPPRSVARLRNYMTLSRSLDKLIVEVRERYFDARLTGAVHEWPPAFPYTLCRIAAKAHESGCLASANLYVSIPTTGVFIFYGRLVTGVKRSVALRR